jgi:hypothetical protein
MGGEAVGRPGARVEAEMGDVLGLAQREIVRDIVAEGVLEAEI